MLFKHAFNIYDPQCNTFKKNNNLGMEHKNRHKFKSLIFKLNIINDRIDDILQYERKRFQLG